MYSILLQQQMCHQIVISQSIDTLKYKRLAKFVYICMIASVFNPDGCKHYSI